MNNPDLLNISLVICTYQRAQSLRNLLNSVQNQVLSPFEVLVIDGSEDEDTGVMVRECFPHEVNYFNVPVASRGLTRQRNFGISKVSAESHIVAFVDDDTVLEPKYFRNLEQVFRENPEVGGVGGVAINENAWKKTTSSTKLGFSTYEIDGYFIQETSRTKIRKLIGLDSPLPPFCMPDFSHVRASGYPITGKYYDVDLLVGMSFSFRKSITDQLKFSLFFDGYGLYEDADYCIRALKYGKNVMHTGVQLSHFHHPSGRPNTYKYGKMVVRNGYYVWRLKYPSPGMKAKLKFHATTALLTLIRGTNVLTGPKRMEALQEYFGRIVGWFSLWINKPTPSQS
ncbi:glycosyltransferase [Algoriphagus sp. AGSA1]|uniref:glycosyltransferase family 2 protein n=1 Tax=Algoriphagus sp. AGSA1 TaxID=2907213 RepID=UPI001F463B43|nr:glycosyltransferase family 2 protein [Algoriphagus sp. AGSA1]MCE7055280.1 glycosyltransferase [Algoriphagus sp. AGSA1]